MTTTTYTSKIITIPINKEPFTCDVRMTIVEGSGLAFHRAVTSNTSGFWNVTHLATKMRFPKEFESDTEAEKFIVRISEFYDCTPDVPVRRDLDEKQAWRLFGTVSYGIAARMIDEQEASC